MILPSNLYSLDQLTTIVWEIEEGLALLKKASDSKPQFSEITERFFALNGIRKFDEVTGATLKEILETARRNSRQIHISTGSVASTDWREKIVEWFRTEIDSQLFCSFSIDPAQGGGVVVRTPKRKYDLTYRQKILNNSGKLMELMK